MEITIAKTVDNEISVGCDGTTSHKASIDNQIRQWVAEPNALENPINMGKKLFEILFPAGTLARQAWEKHPKQILLIIDDDALDAIPWEITYGPDGFIVLDSSFVRGLSKDSRQPAPNLTGHTLHIVAIPSNPISDDLDPLDITGEWENLKDGLKKIDTQLTLERAYPATLEQTRRLVAIQSHRVLHFMGHGGQEDQSSFLYFEDEIGSPKKVTAQDLIRRIEDSAYLVTLNACSSAASGATKFSNFARALTMRGIPYALGMRLPIADQDAKAFSHTFYAELARGGTVENALRQARNRLADSKNVWAVGTPVLYSATENTLRGFDMRQGKPRIIAHQPPIDVFDLPRAEGAFQGRVGELLTLGKYLTENAKVVTIYGAGGQGKTCLAREAAERFAHLWPGGVWSISMDTLPSRYQFALGLAKFLNIDLESLYKFVSSRYPTLDAGGYQTQVEKELEHQLLQILAQQRMLIVLDNAETLVNAVNAKTKAAIDLSIFLREKILSTSAQFLVTSRVHLGWADEAAIELDGLSPTEGGRLFWQNASTRRLDATGPLAQEISRKVEGHPLSLCLLGGAFFASNISLEEFNAQIDAYLLGAQDKYKHEDHRHQTLYSSVETSTRYLNDSEKRLLSILWIFHTFFQAETVEKIVNRLENARQASYNLANIGTQLQSLARRSILQQEIVQVDGKPETLYRVHPAIRLFIQNYMPQIYQQDVLLNLLAVIYYEFSHQAYLHLNSDGWASSLTEKFKIDIERCVVRLQNRSLWEYLLNFGWIWQRLGDRITGLQWLEQALELSERKDPDLAISILNNIALIHNDTGLHAKSLGIFEKILKIHREKGNRKGEALVWNNIGAVQQSLGEMDEAFSSYEKALQLNRRAGDAEGESVTLGNLGTLFQHHGDPEEAITYFEKSLQANRKSTDRQGDAVTLNNLGNTYALIGNPRKALELLDQALQIQQKLGDLAGQGVTLNNMALVFQETGHLDKALELFNRVIEIRRKASDRDGEATTLNNIALLYQSTGKIEDSIELLETALEIVRETQSKAKEATTLNNLALAYHLQEQLDKALELYQQVQLIRKQVGDRYGEATTLSNIGKLYKDTGETGKAFSAYEESLHLSKEVGDLSGQATTLNNLARLYKDTGQPGKALDIYKEALAIARSIENPAREAALLTNMAVLFYMELNRKKDGMASLEQAIRLMRSYRLERIESGSLQQLEQLLDRMRNN